MNYYLANGIKIPNLISKYKMFSFQNNTAWTNGWASRKGKVKCLQTIQVLYITTFFLNQKINRNQFSCMFGKILITV